MANELDKHPQPYNSPAHERTAALVAASLEKINAFPIDDLLALLASGATQTQIAAAVGTTQPAISIWLHGLRGEVAERVEAARTAGGHACMDKGLAALESVKGGDAAAIAWGRAMDQHWSRRAGLYNRRLHDKGELTQQIAQPLQIPSFTIHIIGKDDQCRTIENDDGDAESLI